MDLMLKRGEKVEVKDRLVTVTDLAYESLPRVRDRLIEVAKGRETITYGELHADVNLRYHPSGMGRLLDLLSEECHRRGEPDLASIVVNAATGEVGDDYGGDPVSEREALYRHWA
ncbi:hypothetical protein [Ornithinimicrobium sediminis]|uniref:hypothetical protein n=1 Tax=Ornithinimicrobium sediminis TaxID=2904603 RepID=UPI001E3FE262|nr:hypothetical protein [Ornithinimicrobium sediminis]MCE0488125.1 hypothetical protein [Ornithinimicrobium sediminis]